MGGLSVAVGDRVYGMLRVSGPRDVRVFLEELARATGVPGRMNGDRASLELGVIGNCEVAALIDECARIVWGCLPRPRRRPGLLRAARQATTGDDASGRIRGRPARRDARRRSITCATRPSSRRSCHDAHGNALRIRDFCPRYRTRGRMFRPMMFVRIVEPLAGRPVARIRLRPRCDYGASTPRTHPRVASPGLPRARPANFRLTTNASLSAITSERFFEIDEPLAFLIGPDAAIEEHPLGARAPSSMDATRDLLGRLGARARDPVRVAGRRDPRGHLAQALHLRGHRRGAGGADHVDPRERRQRSQLGLPLLLAARQLLRDPRAESPRRHAHDGGLPALHQAHVRRATSRRRLQPLFSISGEPEVPERVAPGPRGLPGHGSGAGRQRRVPAGPARRLRRDGARVGALVLRRTTGLARRRRAVRAPRDRSARWRLEMWDRPGRRTVGISRRAAHAHVLGGDVLGGLRSAGPHRRAAGSLPERAGLLA